MGCGALHPYSEPLKTHPQMKNEFRGDMDVARGCAQSQFEALSCYRIRVCILNNFDSAAVVGPPKTRNRC
jgi:hypothetical protein